MTKFEWIIEAMFTVQAPEPNYVVNVFWNLVGEQEGVVAQASGATTFDTNQIEPFIPYEQLTSEIVVGWIESALGPQGVANYQACVQGMIDSKINPPPTPEKTPLPWSTPQ